MTDPFRDFVGDLDPFSSFHTSHVDLDPTLNDGSFADLSEAIMAANTAPSHFNGSCMAGQPPWRPSNNSTASSSPFGSGVAIMRPKLGSRFSKEVIRTLKDWLAVHQQHPYPTESEMAALQNRTGLNKAQLTNWFANARRRGKVQSVRPASPKGRDKPTPPIDIIQRPGTPAVRCSLDYKDPMQRWVESPPEHEPAAASDIVRAMASASNGTGDIESGQSWQSPYARSLASSTRTSQSSEFSGHCSSGSQKSLKIRRAPRKKRANRRRRLEKEPVTTPLIMPYQCTFCTEVFRTKYDWQRHEKSLHLPLERWICGLHGPRFAKETNEELCCVFCGETNPDEAHVEAHHYSACQERNLRERTFHRKDHLVQHLRLVHGVEFADWSMSCWMLPIPDVRSRCGFCGITMSTWLERTDHLADHFKSGTTMASWQGDWGFDSYIAPLVETAISPDLIEWERYTLIPMKGSDPSWGTPPNAYELLKIETEFFIQRYFDENGQLPDNDAMQLEACRIIFAAEATSATNSPGKENQHQVSWLRDLVMSSPTLTKRAMFQPVRSSRESRHFPLVINAKGHLFEHCPMEARLRGFVMEQMLAGGVLNDTQLHNQACQIVRQMEQETGTPSDTFANWLVKGIYSGTDWLSKFKQRADIVDIIETAGVPSGPMLETWSGSSWPRLPHANGRVSEPDMTSLSQQTHSSFTPLSEFPEEVSITPSTATQPDTQGRQRTLLPDDTNFYRVFESDMRRWAASTLSPKNPNCHVPSDEEIQHQARWIMFDGDDSWDQTPADFPVWLSRFKREVGITKDVEVVDPKELVTSPP
ncbi:uncharacterized protein SETTUDRAFT_136488 [Exserohilum turcica Et28A]|uniref:Uncharacterized protein n=1 Tax=Exserohilum turcicum (strain 28A) TaxID=671987 RepID=R0IHX3_EXST2|nr:uncharacterized protein SETTUDRAFT_136488 [Exserohilum turcica Et28A]EOA84566.1 hypothetical protein SETTUDRAFT_136488 [Exserohilum turcica Et28A]